LQRLGSNSPEALLESRYQKYRKIGAWQSARREAVGSGP
jgi:hypothetical protein